MPSNDTSLAASGVDRLGTADPLTLDPATLDPKLCPRQITFTIPAAPGGVSVTVTATEDGAGNIDLTARANTTASLTGDLGGLFFQLNDAKLGGLTVTGPNVTLFQTGDDNVVNIAPGINMNGAQPVGYDVGVEFGTAGIGANNQDITKTSFVVSNAADNLTLDDFLQAGETNLFGARVTAIGIPGGTRAGSDKITGDATQPITALPDSVSTLEDKSVTILASALATDPNPNGGALTITEVTQPADGSVTINPGGTSLTFTPGDFVPNGTDSGSFQYCIQDALGSEDSNSISTTVTPVADQPSIVINSVKPGGSVDDTLITFTANAGDFGTPQQGSDFLQSLSLALSGNVTGGVTLSDTLGLLNTATDTFNLSGQPQTFTDTIDVKAPAIGAVGPLPLDLADTLGITAVNEESELTGSPATASATTSQAINIDYSQATETPDFTTQNQNIWGPGNAFTFNFDKFLGIGTTGGAPLSFGGKIGGVTTTPVFGGMFGATGHGSISLKAGFQVDLNINGGSFNGSLPFNVTLNDTYNKTTDTLEVDESDTAGTGSINTTGPSGGFSLDAIFNAMASVGAEICLGVCVGGSTKLGPFDKTITLVKLNSGSPPDMVNFGGVNLSFAYPNVNTSGSGSATSVTSSNQANAFTIGVDVVQVLLEALIGSDPLKGSFAGIGYTLLGGKLSAALGLKQTFTLSDLGITPTLLVGTSQTPESFGAPIQNVSSLGLNPDGSVPLALSFTLNDPMLKNQTDISATGGAGLTIGKISGVGTLAHPHVTIPIGSIPIFSSSFNVAGFQTQTAHVNVA